MQRPLSHQTHRRWESTFTCHVLRDNKFGERVRGRCGALRWCNARGLLEPWRGERAILYDGRRVRIGRVSDELGLLLKRACWAIQSGRNRMCSILFLSARSEPSGGLHPLPLTERWKFCVSYVSVGGTEKAGALCAAGLVAMMTLPRWLPAGDDVTI